MLVVVAVALLAAWSWFRNLGGPDDSGMEGGSFQPRAGAYTSEVITDDGGHVLVPVEIVALPEDRFELRMPWRPPEPTLAAMPPLLAEHADRIGLRVRITSTGHVEDVVGPDDHFDRLDADDPEAADRLRALLLEEQVDAALAWQLTAYVAQPLVEGTTFSFDAALPGYGMTADWQGTIDYDVAAEVDCPEPAGRERCVPIDLRSRPEPDGRSELTGRLLVGVDTGLEWQATLLRQTAERRREVRRRLLRADR